MNIKDKLKAAGCENLLKHYNTVTSNTDIRPLKESTEASRTFLEMQLDVNNEWLPEVIIAMAKYIHRDDLRKFGLEMLSKAPNYAIKHIIQDLDNIKRNK